jgi:hypothetical protein
MCALGVKDRRKGYFSISWNWLDFVVVLSAIFEEVMTLAYEGEEEGGGLVVLRVARGENFVYGGEGDKAAHISFKRRASHLPVSISPPPSPVPSSQY